jgi:hypothetical protein
VTSTTLPAKRHPSAGTLVGPIRSAANRVVAEMASVGLLCAAVAVFLARLSQVNGAKLLFYNSDSLTMPLFARALRAPEGLGWTSGPFLGIFPELPTFLLAEFFTSTPKSALVVCGFFNIFGLYLAMRLLAGACGGSSKDHRRAALIGILVVILGMAAETFGSSEWNLGWMLFSSTYYVGISTMGIVTVPVLQALRQTLRSQASQPREALQTHIEIHSKLQRMRSYRRSNCRHHCFWWLCSPPSPIPCSP